MRMCGSRSPSNHCYGLTFSYASGMLFITLPSGRKLHDELVIEARPDVSLETLCEQMGRTPSWAPGLKLRADGYICDFYMKDYQFTMLAVGLPLCT